MLSSPFRHLVSLGCTLLAAILISPLSPVMAGPAATSGIVLETMNAADYTYLKVETNSQATWVAIPATPVEKGQQVTYLQGMVMENFASKTLGRTFAAIVFSPGLVDAKPTDDVKEPPAEESDSFAAALRKEKEQPQTTAFDKKHSQAVPVPSRLWKRSMFPRRLGKTVLRSANSLPRLRNSMAQPCVCRPGW